VNAFRLAWHHFRVAAMYELQYRLNFFVQLIHSALALLTGLVAIALVFSYVQTLNGWTAPELLAVMGVHILLSGFLRSFVIPNMQDMMRQVQDGEFDFVLVKPVDALLLVSIRRVQVWQLVDVIVGVVVIVWAVIGMEQTMRWWQPLTFIVLLACGGIILYCLWVLITTTAFKWVRVEEITQLMEGVYQTGRWPVAIYPSWLRYSLTFVIPLAFAITIPASALANRITPGVVALALVVTAIVAVATRAAWRYGLRWYSGASA